MLCAGDPAGGIWPQMGTCEVACLSPRKPGRLTASLRLCVPAHCGFQPSKHGGNAPPGRWVHARSLAPLIFWSMGLASTPGAGVFQSCLGIAKAGPRWPSSGTCVHRCLPLLPRARAPRSKKSSRGSAQLLGKRK